MGNAAIDVLRQSMRELGFDVALVTHLPHIRKLTGFSGSSGVLIVAHGDACLFTDGRYAEQVEREVHNVPTKIAAGAPMGSATSFKLLAEAQSLAVQGRHLSAIQLKHLEDSGSKQKITVMDEWLQPLFAPKSNVELRSIRKAQRVTDDVYASLTDVIAEGLTEKQLAAEVVFRHMSRGASGMSFDPIVAFGSNSALPHARPSDRKLKAGDAILLDFGCVVEGYCSDMTRMMFFGTPSRAFQEVYAVVHQAKVAAIDGVRAGIKCNELDAIARGIIDAAGLGDKFSHSLGHGVGLEIHEWPSVSSRSMSPIGEDVVITIEPGVYLPGQFGVRIEDLVLVEDGGCENLTASSSDLVILD